MFFLFLVFELWKVGDYRLAILEVAGMSSLKFRVRDQGAESSELRSGVKQQGSRGRRLGGQHTFLVFPLLLRLPQDVLKELGVLHLHLQVGLAQVSGILPKLRLLAVVLLQG